MQCPFKLLVSMASHINISTGPCRAGEYMDVSDICKPQNLL